MAIWQFRLDLVPTDKLVEKFGVVPISIPKRLAEEAVWWVGKSSSAAMESEIDRFLQRSPSWSTEMKSWGDERGDTASICYDGQGRIEWVGFRVDVRCISMPYIQAICRLAEQFGCVFLTGSYHLFQPNAACVLAAISESTAKKYIDDPSSALPELKQRETEVIRFPKELK